MKNLGGHFTLTIAVLLAISLSLPAQAQDLVGHWTFEPGEELADLVGNFDDVTLNGATIVDGQLDVGEDQWAYVGGYSGPDITEKTLISWVILDSLDITAGSAITIDKISEDEFDGIIYAERQPGQWMNGSSFFRRTTDAVPGFTETETGQLIQMAITYTDDGGDTNVKLYRNGELIGDYTMGAIPTWEADDTEVFFGKRHGDESGGPGNLDAHIEEARIYDDVLSEDEIGALTLVKEGVTSVTPRGKLATSWAAIRAK